MLSPEASRRVDELLTWISVEEGPPAPRPVDASEGEILRNDYLQQLRALSELKGELDHRLDATGRAAIRAGASYAEAGEAAHFTKQRAHQRFRAE
jgi:hypothetical protein